MRTFENLKKRWKINTLGSEAGLHQLSPYIGKLKSSIAASLIEQFSSRGDLIFEPFAGSGSVALESIRLGRSVVACDISPYAAVLTKAKLYPPRSLDAALSRALAYIESAKKKAKCNNYKTNAPPWVRKFFNKRTLAEVQILAETLRIKREWFLLACLLGILHHQRPGFLSFPSSHLVPYLRARNFPRAKFPRLYTYRDVKPRLLAKIHRAFKRMPVFPPSLRKNFFRVDIKRFSPNFKAAAIITSPPYMNALDYGRDNRLRLWFLGVDQSAFMDRRNAQSKDDFSKLMIESAKLFKKCLNPNGYVVMVVGEVRKGHRHPVETNTIVKMAFDHVGCWKLVGETEDLVPDIRRSRRDCRGTKREWIIVFKLNS